MICVFCVAHLATREEAIDNGWLPDFYAGPTNYEGPVCPSCTVHHLAKADDGEMELRPGFALPELAIPLAKRPNLRTASDATSPAFPPSIVHEGTRYTRTGKHGTRVVDGVPTAEYEAHDASRIWLGVDGRVIPE